MSCRPRTEKNTEAGLVQATQTTEAAHLPPERHEHPARVCTAYRRYAIVSGAELADGVQRLASLASRAVISITE
jgi:hypothetical protein